MSVNIRRRIDKAVLTELDLCESWSVVEGSRHYKIIVNGRCALVWPRNAAANSNERNVKNSVAQVRRARKAFDEQHPIHSRGN